MTARPPARVWITRAEPGASRTAARLEAMGLTPIVRPLLAIQPLNSPVPDLARFDALAFTRVNGVVAFCALTPQRDRPVFAVGDTTAQAARKAGFASVASADGDLAALGRLIAGRLDGATVLAPQAEIPAGDLGLALAQAGAGNVVVSPLPVYRADPTPAASPAVFEAVLIHSPRAAVLLAQRLDSPLAHAVVACISAAAAAPVLAKGLTPVIAATPDETALLTILQAALGKRDPAV